MSLKITCDCKICDNIPNKDTRSFAIGYVDNNDSIVEMKCNSGHEFTALLGIPKFAFMFENGLTAFNNGFYFEAFTCFYSSLELFRIDFSKAYFYSFEKKSLSELEEQFKHIKQSERIYGIYMLTYGLYFKKLADRNLDNQKIKFNGKTHNIKSLRNKVYHAGYIPSKEEVEAFGYIIYKYIRATFQTFNIKEADPEDPIPYPTITSYYFELTSDKCKQLGKTMIEILKDDNYIIISSDTQTSMNLNSVLDLSNLPSFEKLLEKNRGNNLNKNFAELISNSPIMEKLSTLVDNIVDLDKKTKKAPRT